MDRAKYWLGLLAVLMLPPAQAVNQEIRALFQPDPAHPNQNAFINKTPNTGYCAIYPDQCVEHKTFSIQVPVRFESSRFILPGEGIPLRIPANWRQLTVTNPDTQETETVEVRLTGIGSQYFLSDTAANLVGVTDILEGHQKLWTTSSWVYVPAPCQYSGAGAYGPERYRFFWKTLVEAACTKVAAYRIPAMAFDTLDFTYEMRTPNPLGMSSGVYTGSLYYALGPGGDFDFGPLMFPNDNNLTLDLVLDVQHTLKVDLPPGGNKVALEPEGGWLRWINEGRLPPRIYRDQTFHISASSRFKVTILCDALQGSLCRLTGSGDPIWVRTYLDLPAGINGPDGRPVNDHLLTFGEWAGPFSPTHYLDRKPGKLRFEIPPDAIEYLLRPGRNETLSGNITVIWDSQV